MLSTQPIHTRSERATKALARRLASRLPGGSIVRLCGPIGAGKTTFAQGFLAAFGVRHVASPTFVLARKITLPHGPIRSIIHADLYRLPVGTDIRELGLSEALNDQRGLLLLEWAERARGIPTTAHTITFAPAGTNRRTLRLSPGLQALLTTPKGRSLAVRRLAAPRSRLGLLNRRRSTSRRSKQ